MDRTGEHTMDFERHCAEIVRQTELLTAGLAGVNLRAPVPSCPGWSLGNLLRHVGGGHRWAEHVVRVRATGFLPDNQVRKLDGDDTAPAPCSWLVEGAERFAATLLAAGPDAAVWTPAHYGRTSFWARRFAHETVVHRADAALATGTRFAVAEDVAVDAFDEWMELNALPIHFEIRPEKRELLGEGRTLAFEATDAGAAWHADLTGDVIVWGRGGGPAAVTVRGPLTDLLLVTYIRASVPAADVEVIGDEKLLDLWLRHVTFG